MSLRPITEADLPAPPRRRWLLAVGIVIGALAAAAVGLLHSPWMSVAEIEVVGAEHADVSARLAAAGIGPGAIMIWIDTAEVEAVVLSDPWVRDARVDRVFPDRLIVEVLEHTPVAWMGGATAWMLAGRDGTILEVAADPGFGLLVATAGFPDGDPGDRPETDTWVELVALGDTLTADVAADLRAFVEAGELWLEGRGLRARLGRPTALAEKGAVFEAMLGENLPAGTIVDLVAPGRPAVVYPTATNLPSTGEGPAHPEPVVEGESDG